MTTTIKKTVSNIRRSDVFDRIILIPNVLKVAEDGIDSNITLRRPLVNITETSSDYAIEVAAPGLELEDFRLELEGNILIISAEKQLGERGYDINYRRQEYSFASFRRAFQFADNVILEEVIGEYLNGIFCVFVPKKEEGEFLVEEMEIEFVQEV